MVVACTTGYQYNGLTLACERTDPTMICAAPEGDSNVYYFDDVTMKCQTCELSTGC